MLFSAGRSVYIDGYTRFEWPRFGHGSGSRLQSLMTIGSPTWLGLG